VVNETENHRITIPEIKSNYKAHRLWKDGDTTSQEYFLVENRQLTGYDVSLPASGLLVWHIDDAVSETPESPLFHESRESRTMNQKAAVLRGSSAVFIIRVALLTPSRQVWGNQNEWHPKVGLLQADGFQQLEHKTSFGDAGDPFPGIANNTTWNATSNPNSKAYSGADTYVSITNIPANSDSMTVDITVKAVSPPKDGFDPKVWYRLTNTFAG